MSLSKKTGNKLHRKNLYVAQKRQNEKEKREARFRRKKEEARDPELRGERIAKNQPVTVDSKRTWDDRDYEAVDELSLNVDMERLIKRRRVQQEEAEERALAATEGQGEEQEMGVDDEDSMLGSDDETAAKARAHRAIREDSLAPSTTSTNIENLVSETSLKTRFPSLFADDPPQPKVLITTSLNSNLHHHAKLLTNLIPCSTYVPRSAHQYAYKYSVREICKFASGRDYTMVMILREDQKQLHGIDIIHLPLGPTFCFSVSSWLDGAKIPGHGNATVHFPELLLNGFSTPLGMLTGRLFQLIFPMVPELAGRQVVSMTNKRDYIFLRRHRYNIRERKETEKKVVGADGKELKGLEDVRVALQELGPRFTLKLRKIYKGIGQAGSEGDDSILWAWKAKMEKKRTRFNL